MLEMEHLPDADIPGYCNGTLDPGHRLSADKHLQQCGGCRRKALRGAGAAISAGRFGPAGSPHIPYEELEAYADARLPDGDRARVISHLDLCPQCRAEADDLCRFRTEIKPAPEPRRALWIVTVAAAAAV